LKIVTTGSGNPRFAKAIVEKLVKD